VAAPDDLARWRAMFVRLRRGPSPRGERFELCREVLAAAPGTDEGRAAARLLLEGAMADSGTSIADAQDVMQALKAISRRQLDIADLLVGA
jgi:hypothetical protein